MKKILLTLTTLLSITSFAGVITVSNNPINPGQYSDIQDAIDNANLNDTILVHGSLTHYGSITINNPVTIIGSGYNNPNGLNTDFMGIALNRVNNSVTPNGARLIGINIGDLQLNTATPGPSSSLLQNIEDIIFERCRINGISLGNYYGIVSNVMFKNCLIYDLSGNILGYHALDTNSSPIDIQFLNNVFSNTSRLLFTAAIDCSNIKFTNNTFVNNTSSFDIVFNYGITGRPGPAFENNIFYGDIPQGCNKCTFNNNITYAGNDNDLINSLNPGSTGGANLTGQDPQFVDFPISGATFDYTQDLNLKPSSPAKGSGVAGVDMGMTGGLYPFDVGANPAIPQMLEITTPLGSSVSKGTNLNVTFKSYKQD